MSQIKQRWQQASC